MLRTATRNVTWSRPCWGNSCQALSGLVKRTTTACGFAIEALTATELVRQLAAGEVTSVELTRRCLDRIERHDGAVRAFLRVDPAAALAQAEEIDRRRKAGKPLGRLAGLPVAVKDVLCTQGEPTTCASRMLENFRPPYDATVVAKLKAADAVLIGRTNMDEFAMGGSNENSAFFPTHNPWDLTRMPGGSSGGSAASVAARMTPLAVGTDTGGSIRCPAGLCGITGMKPTYGRVSRYGLVAFASSLDQIGPLGQTAEDCALLLEVLAGHDPKDSTSIDLPVPKYSETVRQPLDGLAAGAGARAFRRRARPTGRGGGPRGGSACTSRSGRRSESFRCRTASMRWPRITSLPPARPPAIWPATTASITAIAAERDTGVQRSGGRGQGCRERCYDPSRHRPHPTLSQRESGPSNPTTP